MWLMRGATLIKKWYTGCAVMRPAALLFFVHPGGAQTLRGHAHPHEGAMTTPTLSGAGCIERGRLEFLGSRDLGKERDIYRQCGKW